MDALCAWCNATRQPGPVCPQCGADYIKAAAILSKGKADVVEPPISFGAQPQAVTMESDEPDIPVRDPAYEKTMCLFALPTMLSIALFVQFTGFFAGMQRIVFSMPIHELGHAITGWLCGFNSIPTLWKTITPENRGYLSSGLLIIGLVTMARYGLKRKQPTWLAAVAALFLVQLYCTFAISPARADMFITIGGDFMGMILATLLMCLFYVGKDTQIYKGSLRWGFLAIGAAAFMNMFAPWWKKNISEIGYGLTGGIPTDSWKMINLHLWEWEALFNAHITLGMSCLLVLTVVYTLGLRQAMGWERDKRRLDSLARLKKDESV